MSWTTPKTNWKAGDCPTPADFNRAEGNSRQLNKGGGGLFVTAPIVNPSLVSGNYLYDVNLDSDLFIRDGGEGFVTHIRITDRPPGNKITIINTYQNNLRLVMDLGIQPAVDNYKTIKGHGDCDLVNGCSVDLVYTGSHWWIKGNV
jgi:hypothetical protein